MLLASNGFPSAAQQVSVHFSNLCMTGMANSFGLASAAAYGTAVKLDSFAILPCSAINDAVASVASQNLGANKEDRALKSIVSARKIAFAYVICVFLLIFFFAQNLTSIFTEDPEVIAISVSYFKVACFMYFSYAFTYPEQGFLKGSGNSGFVLINSLFLQYLLKIPAAYFLSHRTPLGLRGIAITWIAGPIFSAITYSVYIHMGKWRKHWKKQEA